ncbi:hypothetical protein F53441_6655 [Fusarium austroafricanum]|uniref:Uncharacterized protein n=1 Tax=Fusarium austroafricanum TaxID=2364996 RepID=A0A8H4KI51_9HYPO|nr:hypothetical protein F53441_6655 [Fusarium austroafricanum]
MARFTLFASLLPLVAFAGVEAGPCKPSSSVATTAVSLSAATETTISNSGTTEVETTTVAEVQSSTTVVEIETTTTTHETEVKTTTTDASETLPDTAAQETTSSSEVPIESAPSSSMGDTTKVPTTTTTQDSTTTTTMPPVDACVFGVTSPNGEPVLEQRNADCYDYNVVTVSPYTYTETVFVHRRVKRGVTIDSAPTPAPRQAIRREADIETATTIQPTEKPAYATYCDSAEDYYDACSSLRITRHTSSLATPTTTVHSFIKTIYT